MSKTRFNKKQKAKVTFWQAELGTRSRITRLVDRTCGYRDAYISWNKQLNQPNNQIAIVEYITRLELTKAGGLRVEETEQENVFYIDGCLENKIIPLFPELPLLPKTTIDQSLYPRDRTQRPKTKPVRNRQLSLPLSETEQKLLDISMSNGDRTVYSTEELLSGKEGWYSLDQNRTVFLAAPILILLKDFDCSLEECEAIATMAGVMSPQDLLFWVEQIPQMRKAPQFEKFQEPVTSKLPQELVQTTNDRQLQNKEQCLVRFY